jgi:hypothetical protein
MHTTLYTNSINDKQSFYFLIFFWTIALNKRVKVLFATLIWLFVYGWQVIENKVLVPNLPHKTF